VSDQQEKATALLRALFEVRQACLDGIAPEAILDQGARIVAATLDADVRLFEYAQDRSTLLERRRGNGDGVSLAGEPKVMGALERPGELRLQVEEGGGFTVWTALRGHGVPIGAMALRRQDGGSLDENEQLFLRDAALQLSVAVERTRIEADLREQQRRRRTLIHNLAGAGYRCDPAADQRISYLSEPIEAITGYQRARLLEGRPSFDDLILEDDRERVRGEVAQAIREKRSFLVTYRIRSKEGGERWIWEKGRGVPDPTGNVVAVEGLLLDITEERRGAEEEERLLRRLQEAIHLRDEFLLVASHELRTPLTPLNIELQMLLRILSEERSDLVVRVERALRQVDRLWRMTEGMLDVSRLSAGRLQLELDVVDLGELVEEVVSLFTKEARRRGIELRVEGEQGMCGFWDRHRLHQVFENLISNAVRFGAARPIDIRIERAGDVARVTVRDRGIGIEPGQLESIFQRYARAVSFREYGGLGLGLFLTRKLVEAHGGRVWAEHASGHGSTFVVELPWGVGGL
jgi:PAS domain S-box-containing protein